MVRNVIGSLIALIGAAAAVWSPFRAWYDGRPGTDFRIEDLFNGITDQQADTVRSVLLPMLVAALITLVGVLLRARPLVTLAGVLVLGFTVLWMVRQGQAAGSLTAGGGRGLGPGVAVALCGGVLLLLGAVVMSGRRAVRARRHRRGRAGDAEGEYAPEPAYGAAPPGYGAGPAQGASPGYGPGTGRPHGGGYPPDQGYAPTPPEPWDPASGPPEPPRPAPPPTGPPVTWGAGRDLGHEPGPPADGPRPAAREPWPEMQDTSATRPLTSPPAAAPPTGSPTAGSPTAGPYGPEQTPADPFSQGQSPADPYGQEQTPADRTQQLPRTPPPDGPHDGGRAPEDASRDGRPPEGRGRPEDRG